MLKKLILCLLAMVTVASCFTSCDSIGAVEQLLTPPRSGGELYDIQQALYTFAGRSVKLHYARTGDNRAAFIRSDIDGDKVQEAVAFYSVANAEGVAEIHINIISCSQMTYILYHRYAFCQVFFGIFSLIIENLLPFFVIFHNT